MPRAKTTPHPVDPLADLREDEPASPAAPQPEPAPDPRPLVTAAAQDEAVAVAIAAWHADQVAMGFLHGGGQCGCRYLARVAIAAALPAVPDDEAGA